MFAILMLIASDGLANDYWEVHQREVGKCAEIKPGAYRSGLIMNPDGYRSYYERSACFQGLAVRLRDIALCDQVRRRWSLFGSSWGYSRKNCEKLVEEGLAKDRAHVAELRQKYNSGPVRLTDFRVVQNGNGRDYDIIPKFSAGLAHGYHLEFRIVHEGNRFLLSESGFHLDGRNNIRMFEYRKDIEQRFPAFQPGSSYVVEGKLTLSIGTGNLGGRWSPEFITTEFPASVRSQKVTRRVSFD